MSSLNELIIHVREKEELQNFFAPYAHDSYKDIEQEDRLRTITQVTHQGLFRAIQQALKAHDYVIVRNFGCNLAAHVSLVYFLSSGKLFYIPHLQDIEKNAFIAHFCMTQTQELSHTLKDGYFHTDYSLAKQAPSFITLQTIQADPKYPYFSRNSFVSSQSILAFLKQHRPELLDFLSNIELPTTNGKTTIKQSILHGTHFKFHDKLIRDAVKNDKNYEKYLPYLDDFITIAQSLSIDFALDRGDLAIFSNQTLLHKRNEASLSFNTKNNKFTGREVYSIRFYL